MKDISTRDKELIGLAIDAGEPLPDWLQQKLADESSQKGFFDLSIQLTEELRGSASQWVDRYRSNCSGSNLAFAESLKARLDTTIPVSTSSSRFSRSRFAWMSVSAAGLFLSLGWLFHSSNRFPLGESAISQARPQVLEESSESLSSMNSESMMALETVPGQVREISAEEQFERYFYVTVESSFRTLHSVGETLTEKAVGEPLSRTIQQCTLASDLNDSSEVALSGNPRLNSQQIQLIQDLLRTADFLVDTFPKQATRPWMELSLASRESQ